MTVSIQPGPASRWWSVLAVVVQLVLFAAIAALLILTYGACERSR